VALARSILTEPEGQLCVVLLGPANDRPSYLDELHLLPMSDDDATRLITARLAVEDGLAAVVRARSHGNPGAIESLLRAALPQLHPTPTGYRLSPGGRLDFSGTGWRAQVSRALEGQPESVAQGAERLALLGATPSRAEVAAADIASGAIEQLCLFGLWTPTQTGWTVHHPEITAVLVGRASAAGRLREHHAICAEACDEAERRAMHLFGAEMWSEAAPELYAAALAANLARRPRRALDLLGSYESALDALDVPASDHRRALVELRRAAAANHTGNRTLLSQAVDRLRSHKNQDGWSKPAVYALLHMAHLRNYVDPARMALLREALAEAELYEDPALNAEVQRSLARNLAFLGDQSGAEAAYRAALSLVPARGRERAQQSNSWHEFGRFLLRAERFQEALEAGRRALEYAEADSHEWHSAQAVIGSAHRSSGDLVAAQQAFTHGLHAPDPMGRQVGRLNVALLRILAQDYTGALKVLHGVSFARIGAERMDAVTQAFRGTCSAGLGAWSDFDTQMESARRSLERSGLKEPDVAAATDIAAALAEHDPERAALAREVGRLAT